MKLLFDHNLSPALVRWLAPEFPGSTHVADEGLDKATDDEIWKFAKDHDLAIVTKDADYSDLSTVRGFPPKVVWLQIGNCTNRQVETLLRTHLAALEAFETDTKLGVMALY